MSSTPTRKKISKSVSNARKVIRKLDSEGWRLVAFDVLDGDGMQPIQEWKVDTSYTPPYKSVKSTAILGGDVVNSVDYSVLFFENEYNMKMHLCCVPVEATGEESVVNDIAAESEEVLEMVEDILNS